MNNMVENEVLEFKSCVSKSVLKAIIAFANTDGGKVLIGVDDNGIEIGLDNIDEEYTRLTNMVRDCISPDITLNLKYSLMKNNVISIDVLEGINKPYYLKEFGLRPLGVYVRQGASSVQAYLDGIRDMIKKADGDIWEEMRSLNQTLTFSYTKQVFEEKGVAFSEDKYPALGFIPSRGKGFSNLALLFSDENPYTIKIGVFKDSNNTVFKSAKELSGSLLNQLAQAFDFLSLNNNQNYTFEGLVRVENLDYPEFALREALLNAIIHRDYDRNASIIINLNEERAEFLSPGGLVEGYVEEDIINGLSIQRNVALASIFMRLKYIESYGTGLKRIFSLYKDCSNQPKLSITQNTFKLILPNKNFSSDVKIPTYYELCEKKPHLSPLTSQEKELLSVIQKDGSLTDLDIMRILNVKKTRAFNVVKNMEAKRLIKIEGRGDKKRYKPY